MIVICLILINNTFTMGNTGSGSGSGSGTGSGSGIGSITRTEAEKTERKALLTEAINTLAQLIKDDAQRVADAETQAYELLKQKACGRRHSI